MSWYIVFKIDSASREVIESHSAPVDPNHLYYCGPLDSADAAREILDDYAKTDPELRDAELNCRRVVLDCREVKRADSIINRADVLKWTKMIDNQ